MSDWITRIDPASIEAIATAFASIVVAVGAAIGRVRRAIGTAIRKARGRGGTAAALAFAALALGGCAAGAGGSLGETRVTADFDSRAEAARAAAEAQCEGVSDDVLKAALAPSPAQITMAGGQDKQQVGWTLDIADGTASYDASEVVATDPAAVRARIVGDLTAEQRKALESALPGGIGALVDRIVGAAGR